MLSANRVAPEVLEIRIAHSVPSDLHTLAETFVSGLFYNAGDP